MWRSPFGACHATVGSEGSEYRCCGIASDRVRPLQRGTCHHRADLCRHTNCCRPCRSERCSKRKRVAACRPKECGGCWLVRLCNLCRSGRCCRQCGALLRGYWGLLDRRECPTVHRAGQVEDRSRQLCRLSVPRSKVSCWCLHLDRPQRSRHRPSPSCSAQQRSVGVADQITPLSTRHPLLPRNVK